ncbi:hypothetical protein TSOC_001354 [Tetrabaena socialis]|uniref:Uncharacterized protein n=1 Tax=Tetrabaena socialis TaxID=47790 RepID=A0A2J8AGY1_9CHLO|nr:hypothetical protein TSOC_001354 [Tetrabaena socialis]|eukprot:PNH11778.1 hypothetical protein TSOC_001354 [Tetrabaena socialis]
MACLHTTPSMRTFLRPCDARIRGGRSVWPRHAKGGQAHLPSRLSPPARALPFDLDTFHLDTAALASIDTAQIVAVLKGPSLAELMPYGRAAWSVAGAAWYSLVSPFALFGDDKWSMNLLFYASVLLMAYNLVLKSPKQ